MTNCLVRSLASGFFQPTAAASRDLSRMIQQETEDISVAAHATDTSEVKGCGLMRVRTSSLLER